MIIFVLRLFQQSIQLYKSGIIFLYYSYPIRVGRVIERKRHFKNGKTKLFVFLELWLCSYWSEHSRKPSKRCFKWRISAQNGGFKFCNSALLFFINSYSLRVRKEAVEWDCTVVQSLWNSSAVPQNLNLFTIWPSNSICRYRPKRI